MEATQHRRTTRTLAATAVLLVLAAWVTKGAASLAVAILAAGVAFSLVAHEALGAAEVPARGSVRQRPHAGGCSAA